MQIVCGEDKYNYDLPNDGTATFFPLNMGNGTYTFRLMEQVGDSKYACIGSEDRDVTLKDEFQPYLRPNQMVNYNKSSDCIKKVKELAASCTTDADIAAAVYDYMVKNIQYDTEKAATVQNGYLPSPDETLKTGKGICFDYASLAAAMLRSEGIPCKLITGYVGEETYHAWNSFYVESEGWITVEIRAKADEWQRVDITFGRRRHARRGDSKRFGIHNAVHLLKEKRKDEEHGRKIFDSGTAQRILQQPCDAAALRRVAFGGFFPV